MIKLFDIIPSGFFNCLSSGSNHRIYSDCLQIIYEQYDREVSYRIDRNRIRDAIAVYLLENHVDFMETEEDAEKQKSHNDLANGIIRKLCCREIGWLEEDNDDAAYGWIHFGDIDPDGFYILEHLKRGTGIDVEPVYMNKTYLEKYNQFTKPLTENDRKKATRLLEDGKYCEIMKYMLDTGTKLEQEIISWMEIV